MLAVIQNATKYQLRVDALDESPKSKILIDRLQAEFGGGLFASILLKSSNYTSQFIVAISMHDLNDDRKTSFIVMHTVRDLEFLELKYPKVRHAATLANLSQIPVVITLNGEKYMYIIHRPPAGGSPIPDTCRAKS